MDYLSKMDFIFSFKLHIQPSELDNLWFYRAEKILDEYEDYIQKEEENQKKQNDEISLQQRQIGNMSNPSNIINSFKMPEMPKINIPKF